MLILTLSAANLAFKAKVKFSHPDQPHLDLAKQFIRNLIQVNVAGMAEILLPSEELVIDNHHVLINWTTGGVIFDETGKKPKVGGFKFIGYNTTMANFYYFQSTLLEHQCSLSVQKLWTERALPLTLAMDHYIDPDENRVAIWRGALVGFFFEQYGYAALEEGFYTFTFKKDSQGQLKIHKIIAYDMEVEIPKDLHPVLYALSPKKRCQQVRVWYEANKYRWFPFMDDLARYPNVGH